MYSLMKGLMERGEECDMLCAALTGRGRRLNIGNRAQVFCTGTWLKLSGTMISPQMILAAKRICGRYDLVHVHHPDPMAALALFLSGYKGRVILHWHSDIVKQRLALLFYRPLQEWLISRADMIVATSPAYLAASPYLKGVQHKAECLPIGVDAIVPDNNKVEALRRQYAGKKIIFSLGRMVMYKGFEYLIRSAGYLDDSYVILIGGEGPLRGQLINEIRICGLKDKVKLLGFISDDELPAYFGACSVFCLPSVEKTEAYGIVQIEAMSCGKPVVATMIEGSGVSWVNAHGRSGLNVKSRDSHALAEAFDAITKDAATYQSFCRGARERFQSVFTRERMISAYHKLLCQCLDK